MKCRLFVSKFLCLFLITIFLSFSSCKVNYTFSDNALLLTGGEKSEYSYIYNGMSFFKMPNQSYMVKNGTKEKKIKFVVYKILYDSDNEVTNVVANRTYILKNDNVLELYLYNYSSYNPITKEVTKLPGEVIYLEDGVSIYLEHGVA